MLKKLKYRYRALRYKYKLDSPEIRSISQHLKKGDTAVDIGMHKGAYLYWLNKSVGKTGQVFGFEPQPQLYAYLKGIKQAFDYQNITLENKGVSSQKGQFSLFVPDNNGKGTSPGATLNASKAEEEACTEIQIETVTLDEYFHPEQKIVLIKIDVEGHEMAVFQGAQRLLNEQHPVLLFECEQRHNKELDIHDIFEYLKGLGYSGYFFHENQIKPIEAFSLEQHQIHPDPKSSAYCNNFLFKI